MTPAAFFFLALALVFAGIACWALLRAQRNQHGSVR